MEQIYKGKDEKGSLRTEKALSTYQTESLSRCLRM